MKKLNWNYWYFFCFQIGLLVGIGVTAPSPSVKLTAFGGILILGIMAYIGRKKIRTTNKEGWKEGEK